MAELSLHIDAGQAVADLELLAQAAKRFPQVRQRLLDLGDFAPGTRLVQAEPLAAKPAGDLRFVCQLPHGVRQLAAAVRAGEFDAL